MDLERMLFALALAAGMANAITGDSRLITMPAVLWRVSFRIALFEACLGRR